MLKWLCTKKKTENVEKKETIVKKQDSCIEDFKDQTTGQGILEDDVDADLNANIADYFGHKKKNVDQSVSTIQLDHSVGLNLLEDVKY